MNWKDFKNQAPAKQALLEQIAGYCEPEQKVLMHFRINPQTAMVFKQFKLATGIETQQILAFAIDEFLKLHPEVKLIVKQFLQELNE